MNTDLNIINNVPTPTESAIENKVVLTIFGNDYLYDYEYLGITFDTPDNEILSRMNSIIKEISESLNNTDETIMDDDTEEYTYVVRKAKNINAVHIIPYAGAANN